MRYLTIFIVMMSLWFASPSAHANTIIGDLQFADNFDSLMAQAQQSQKIIILDWYTDW
jgi:thiol:disulfide interchange protein